ncbi:MAG: hypothetical protein HY908_30995 [Myxococcales bacterium]|nr:hypothetical protein [Myxococcales bacterium]MCC6527391.1 hypothetical protein [Polyangiaceae bacterium]
MGMSDDEKEYVRRVGSWFYGHAPSQVTEELGNVVAEMMQKCIDGTKAMHLVPRPTGGMPGWTWLVSQAVRAWWDVHHTERVYEAVKRSVALGYKSAYHMAELGV